MKNYSEKECLKEILKALQEPFIMFPASAEDTRIIKYIITCSNNKPSEDLPRRFWRIKLHK